MGKALLVVCALAATASADRFQLVDGRVVEGHITGGDAASYYVQTAHGYFAIARAQVVSITPTSHLGAPPPPPPPAPAPRYEGSPAVRRGLGVALFAGTYLMTLSIALSRGKEDDDASYALVPVLGPVLWTTRDDDRFLHDGWDWLALSSTALQAVGVIGIFSGRRSDATVQVAPVAGQGYGGVTASGRW